MKLRQLSLLCWLFFFAVIAAAQQQSKNADQSQSVSQDDVPTANPGRPTVSTPATLTPVGYFQFETGFLGARQSPGLTSQESFGEVIKFSVSRWIELLAVSAPYAHSV